MVNIPYRQKGQGVILEQNIIWRPPLKLKVNQLCLPKPPVRAKKQLKETFCETNGNKNWIQPDDNNLTTTWLQPEYTTRLQPEHNQTTTWLYYVTWHQICYILHLKPQFFVNLIIKTIKTCICKLKHLGKSFTKYFFFMKFQGI